VQNFVGLPRAGGRLQDRDHTVTKRTVNLGACTYVDVNGAQRFGVAGETVDVHPDNLERFSRVNGSTPETKPAKKAAPRRK
jgi:hypothetical protein